MADASHPVRQLLDAGRQADLTARRAAFAPERLGLRVLSLGDPEMVLDQVMTNEQVHAIADRSDLERRLAPDRTILSLVHAELPDRLLVFVEVALVRGLEVSMADVLGGAVADPARADTAIFYSINRCEDALAGLDVPAELLRRAVPHLNERHPGLTCCSTLSPIPSLRAHVTEVRPELAAALDGGADEAEDRSALTAVAAEVTAPGDDGRVHDPVARFHLGNGATRVALRWGADTSDAGWRRSWRLMANYRYWP